MDRLRKRTSFPGLHPESGNEASWWLPDATGDRCGIRPQEHRCGSAGYYWGLKPLQQELNKLSQSTFLGGGEGEVKKKLDWTSEQIAITCLSTALLIDFY